MSSPISADTPEPTISVLMCVYNGAKDVSAAIDSILAQTFRDFEFIIVDDGSKDETPQILARYAAQDSRIRIVSQKNMGLTRSLNMGIVHARGEYLARQDADDISYPDRLQKQIDMFKARSDLLLVGGGSDDLQSDGSKTAWPVYSDEELASVVFYKTPFPHSTAMMRLDACWRLGCYDESFRTSQDMEFWMRFAEDGPISMVREPVLLRKVGGESISAKRRWRQSYDGLRARVKHAPNIFMALFHAVRATTITFMPAPLVQKIKGALS